MNKDFFSEKFLLMIRTRFFRRMGAQLPHEGTSLFSQICLPESLGGLGLYLEGELPSMIMSSPTPTLQVVCKALENQSTVRVQKILSSLPSNSSARGEDLPKDILINIVDHISNENQEGALKTASPDQVRARLLLPVGTPFRELFSRARSAGWITFDEYQNRLFRGILFTKMMSTEAGGNPFSTEQWKYRYARTWDLIFDKDYVPQERTLDQVKELHSVDRLFPTKLYNWHTGLLFLGGFAVNNIVPRTAVIDQRAMMQALIKLDKDWSCNEVTFNSALKAPYQVLSRRPKTITVVRSSRIYEEEWCSLQVSLLSHIQTRYGPINDPGKAEFDLVDSEPSSGLTQPMEGLDLDLPEEEDMAPLETVPDPQPDIILRPRVKRSFLESGLDILNILFEKRRR
jgi:hypothetical protein